jgi:hypothetical protein
MKKVYLFGGMLLMSAVSISQQTNKAHNLQEAKAYERTYSPTGSAYSQNTGAQNQDRSLNVLWTEDFSGATALTTGNGVWTTGAANGGYWTMSSATTHILSGFTMGLDGRHLRWNSYTPNASETAFATTTVNGHITTPSMDLSGQTNGAVVEFEVQAMYCCNYEEKPFYMYVSQNDGATWSAPITIDFGVDRNEATEDISAPIMYAVDISSYISTTPGTVMLRFSWEATAADPNGQKNTHYYWMIDNLQIYETPLFEVQNQKMWLEDIQTWYEYGELPTSQAQTLTVQNMVKSIGSSSPTGFEMEVTVFNSSMVQVHQSTGGALSNPPMTLNDIDTITFATTFDLSTLAAGQYTIRTVTLYNEADEVTANDTLFRTLEITDNLMSHLNLDAPATADHSGGSSNEGYLIGSSFLLYENATLHGADFYIATGNTSNPTTDDVEVEFSVYEYDGSAYSFLDGPWKYTITNSMLDQYNTFNFHLNEDGDSYTPIEMVAGTEYLVVMEVFGGSRVWYGINPFDEDQSGRYNDGSTWYLSSGEPMIALNFDNALGLAEQEKYTNFSIGQNVPNPFDNSSVITYTLNEASNVSVLITDVTGKVVQTITPGNQVAGTHTLTIDAANLADGMYFYTFTVGNETVTKQMVVSKK